MAESRRSFFGTLLALVTVPLVAKATSARQPFLHHQSPAIDPWPLKPFAEVNAPIEDMITIPTNGGHELLLVVSGGTGYLVDRRGSQR